MSHRQLSRSGEGHLVFLCLSPASSLLLILTIYIGFDRVSQQLFDLTQQILVKNLLCVRDREVLEIRL